MFILPGTFFDECSFSSVTVCLDWLKHQIIIKKWFVRPWDPTRSPWLSMTSLLLLKLQAKDKTCRLLNSFQEDIHSQAAFHHKVSCQHPFNSFISQSGCHGISVASIGSALIFSSPILSIPLLYTGNKPVWLAATFKHSSINNPNAAITNSYNYSTTCTSLWNTHKPTGNC